MTRLELPFTIDRWEALPADTDEVPAVEGGENVPDDQAPDMAAVVLAKTYRGDELMGTATGHALTTRGPLGASYVAQERIVGTLLGRAGSFVLEHSASMGEGVETRTHAVVVAGSATGELTGLTGTGLVEHELLTLDIEFAEDQRPE